MHRLDNINFLFKIWLSICNACGINNIFSEEIYIDVELLTAFFDKKILTENFKLFKKKNLKHVFLLEMVWDFLKDINKHI